jgi:TRAP-type C4-dicarboxylate transport system substrate-binding protein
MDTREITTPEQAEALLREMTDKHGTPVYIVHVPGRILKMVPLEVRREILAGAHTSKGWERQAKEEGRRAIIRYAKENFAVMVTVKELAEMAGVSQSIARETVKANPRLFRKSEGRTYECRGEADL